MRSLSMARTYNDFERSLTDRFSGNCLQNDLPHLLSFLLLNQCVVLNFPPELFVVLAVTQLPQSISPLAVAVIDQQFRTAVVLQQFLILMAPAGRNNRHPLRQGADQAMKT